MLNRNNPIKFKEIWKKVWQFLKEMVLLKIIGTLATIGTIGFFNGTKIVGAISPTFFIPCTLFMVSIILAVAAAVFMIDDEL